MAELLPGLLDANLRRGGRSHALDLLSLDRTGRTELAEALAGTTNKRSREYKSARRRIERWERNGVSRITPRSRKQLVGASRTLGNRRHDDFRRRGADMRVEITWYEGRRTEWLPPGRWVRIDAHTMRTVLRWWSEQEIKLAAGLLYAAFLEQYGVPNIDDWLAETEVIGLALEPSK